MDWLGHVERNYGSVNEYNRCMEEEMDYYEEDLKPMKGINLGECTALCHCEEEMNCNDFRVFGEIESYYFICPYIRCKHDGKVHGDYVDNTVPGDKILRDYCENWESEDYTSCPKNIECGECIVSGRHNR